MAPLVARVSSHTRGIVRSSCDANRVGKKGRIARATYMMVEGKRNSGSETPLLLRTSFESAGPVSNPACHACRSRARSYRFFSILGHKAPRLPDLMGQPAVFRSSTHTTHHADKDAEESKSQLPKRLSVRRGDDLVGIVDRITVPLIEAVVILEHECECLSTT